MGGSNAAFQPRKYTSYDRDANGTDEATYRRYNRWHSRFDQPDPFDGSYDASNPQSLNRYSYTQGDPVNFIDPSGLDSICWTENGERICIPDTEWERIYTFRWTDMKSLFGPYYLPASRSGHGPMIVLPLAPADGGEGQAAGPRGPTPTPQPSLPPCNVTGSGDLTFQAISPFFVGPTGRFQFDNRGVNPYHGLAVGTPGRGVSLMAQNSPVSPGLNVSISGGSVLGLGYSTNVPWNMSTGTDVWRAMKGGSFQFGMTTPGASASAVIVHNPIYRRSCR